MSKQLNDARKNVLNACYDMDSLMQFADAWISVGHTIFSNYSNPETRDKFFKGCSMMRDALYTHQSEQIRRLFYLVGVADDEMISYVKKKMDERFGDNMEIMTFMDKWGAIGSWYDADEKALRRSVLDNTTKRKN